MSRALFTKHTTGDGTNQYTTTLSRRKVSQFEFGNPGQEITDFILTPTFDDVAWRESYKVHNQGTGKMETWGPTVNGPPGSITEADYVLKSGLYAGSSRPTMFSKRMIVWEPVEALTNTGQTVPAPPSGPDLPVSMQDEDARADDEEEAAAEQVLLEKITKRLASFTSTPGQSFVQPAVAEIDKFRIVSQTIKLSSLNTVDDDGSWFEAIRIPADYTTSQVMMNWAGGARYAIRPRDNWETMYMNDISDNPSYITGKLYDLQKYTWKLQRNQNVPPLHLFPKQIVEGINAPEEFFDNSWDSLLIRVHGNATRDAAGTPTGKTPTRLLVQGEQKVEVAFGKGSILTSFASNTGRYVERKLRPAMNNMATYYRRTGRQLKLTNRRYRRTRK